MTKKGSKEEEEKLLMMVAFNCTAGKASKYFSGGFFKMAQKNWNCGKILTTTLKLVREKARLKSVS